MFSVGISSKLRKLWSASESIYMAYLLCLAIISFIDYRKYWYQLLSSNDISTATTAAKAVTINKIIDNNRSNKHLYMYTFICIYLHT